MDYNKMTKQELIDKLEEQVHLAEAVRAKDKEMSELRKRTDDDVARYKAEITRQDQERARLESELVKVNEVLKHTPKKEDVDKMANAAKHYIMAYRDLIKVLKLNTDLAITHEELLAGLLK